LKAPSDAYFWLMPVADFGAAAAAFAALAVMLTQLDASINVLTAGHPTHFGALKGPPGVEPR